MAYDRSPRPTSSPWGAPQHARELAPGIWTVSTSGHGGIHLSDARNQAVPEEVRATSGWYEEDCLWSIPALVHDDGFTADEQSFARKILLNSQPEAFTRLTGETVLPGQSVAADRRRFYSDHPDAWVATSAFGDQFAWVPAHQVGVFARQGPLGSQQYHARERCFLISAAEYQSRAHSAVGYVIKPSDPEINAPSLQTLHRKKAA